MSSINQAASCFRHERARQEVGCLSRWQRAWQQPQRPIRLALRPPKNWRNRIDYIHKNRRLWRERVTCKISWVKHGGLERMGGTGQKLPARIVETDSSVSGTCLSSDLKGAR